MVSVTPIVKIVLRTMAMARNEKIVKHRWRLSSTKLGPSMNSNNITVLCMLAFSDVITAKIYHRVPEKKGEKSFLLVEPYSN